MQNQETMQNQEKSWQETIQLQGTQVLEQVNRLLQEGNVRRIKIKQGDRTVVEFPLTLGVVGAVIAPTLAAVGAVAALLTNCSIEVERTGEKPSGDKSSEDSKESDPILLPGAEGH